MRKIVFSLIFSISLLGCESDQDTRLQDSINNTSPTAIFNPSGGVIPFPSNLLFSGTTDGTLNIPVEDPADLSDPKVAMNSLDGFSTNTPITTTFRSPIDAATIPGNVRVFAATINDFHLNPGAPTFVVTDISSELAFGSDFVATVSAETTLVIVPLKPLAAASGYVVVITNGLKNTAGQAYLPDTTYAIVKEIESLIVKVFNDQDEVIAEYSRLPALSLAQATALEKIRLLTNATENAVNIFDVTLATTDIILSWSFSTQSIGDVINNVKATLPDAPTVEILNQLPFTNVDVYTGTIDVPYYLEKEDLGPVTGFWKGNNGDILSLVNGKIPVPTETISIPVLITVPSNATYDEGGINGVGGIPIVIYQHGITTNRTTGLALADTLASIGYAMVAIDLPLHGVTDDTSPFYSMGNERTFDMDLVNNETNEAGPDGKKDSSGFHFINLTSLQTSRDNVRQGVVDLLTLFNAIDDFDVNGGGADFDPANVSFIGHSLGGIVGIPFLALEPNVNAAVIAMSGGGIAKILDGSATFGPRIANGLAANGVLKGTADYEGFMLAAQTVLDSADPINYGADAKTNRNILFLEIIGSPTSPADLVIPNTIPDTNSIANTVAAPLAGTEPLIGPWIMALDQIDSSIPISEPLGPGLDISIKFNAGHHGSLLTPNNAAGEPDAVSAQVIAEMHLNLKTFLASSGTAVKIDNSNNVIAPLPLPLP